MKVMRRNETKEEKQFDKQGVIRIAFKVNF